MTTMMRGLAAAAAVGAVVLAAMPVRAQGDLARRIAAAPAGDVRLEFATRDGACGDGRSTVSLGRMFHGWNIEGFGTWSRENRCMPGDARVTIVRREGAVTEVRLTVGGRWADGAAGTSLGRVGAAEAAAYFLQLAGAATAEGRVPRGALWAVAIADSTQPARQLLAFALDEARPWKARSTAMQLAGATGDAAIAAELERLAQSGARDEAGDARRDERARRKKDEGNVARLAAGALGAMPDDLGLEALIRLARGAPDAGVRKTAVFHAAQSGDPRGVRIARAGRQAGALGAMPDDLGLEALIRLARGAPDAGVRKTAVFHAAQSGDPRGVRIARAVAEDAGADAEVRQSAIFALLNREEVAQEDRQWARTLFGRLTEDRLRDPILMGLAQHGSDDDRRWVLGLASDDALPVKVRRQAIFWSGQGGTPIADLVRVYGTLGSREVKEHVIFALSQRQETAATDALVDIAKGDGDREMRRKALFWLGQRKDDRAMKVLSDIINQ